MFAHIHYMLLLKFGCCSANFVVFLPLLSEHLGLLVLSTKILCPLQVQEQSDDVVDTENADTQEQHEIKQEPGDDSDTERTPISDSDRYTICVNDDLNLHGEMVSDHSTNIKDEDTDLESSANIKSEIVNPSSSDEPESVENKSSENIEQDESVSVKETENTSDVKTELAESERQSPTSEAEVQIQSGDTDHKNPTSEAEVPIQSGHADSKSPTLEAEVQNKSDDEETQDQDFSDAKESLDVETSQAWKSYHTYRIV